jgi:hypothetical protein
MSAAAVSAASTNTAVTHNTTYTEHASSPHITVSTASYQALTVYISALTAGFLKAHRLSRCSIGISISMMLKAAIVSSSLLNRLEPWMTLLFSALMLKPAASMVCKTRCTRASNAVRVVQC